MALSYVTAAITENFINSFGVNTHIDFIWTSYNNLTVVENSINYLGIKNLRDSANSPADAGPNGLWQQVASATGGKFDAFMQEGSPSQMAGSLTAVPQLAAQGIVNFIEGGNEEDDSYAVAGGNSLANAASFQQQVYALGHKLGLPVINMSFGAGWGASPTGDYAAVGNLAAYADYANAHTYMGTGNPPQSTIATLNSDAQLAAVGRPVITSEFGYYTDGSTTDPSNVSPAVQAKYILDGLLDAFQAGSVKTYLYELLDQNPSGGSEGNFGLFNADGTPKLAATAIHNLTTLLADQGGGFTPSALTFGLSGTLATDHSLLLQKSDGSFWLALWNEARLAGPASPADITVPSHQVTLTLQNAATSIAIYDPLTGTTAIQSASQTASINLALPDHPILVEIMPGSPSTVPVAAPAPVPQDLTVVLPASPSAAAGQTAAIGGVSISDSWALSHAGNMALNIGVQSGAIEISDGSTNYTGVAGQTLHLSGSLSQLNSDLASLQYLATGNGGADTLSVNVWNQAGVSTTQNLAIGITGISSAAAASPVVAVTPQDLVIVTPSVAENATHGQTQLLSGVSISDAWAQNHAGGLALNISAGSGTVALGGGSAGQTLHLTGTLAQLNADLANLAYTAPASAGTDAVTLNVWNQAGVSATQAVAVDIL